jgi:molybdopterin biosynthesis enzyme MoaB
MWAVAGHCDATLCCFKLVRGFVEIFLKIYYRNPTAGVISRQVGHTTAETVVLVTGCATYATEQYVSRIGYLKERVRT